MKRLLPVVLMLAVLIPACSSVLAGGYYYSTPPPCSKIGKKAAAVKKVGPAIQPKRREAVKAKRPGPSQARKGASAPVRPVIVRCYVSDKEMAKLKNSLSISLKATVDKAIAKEMAKLKGELVEAVQREQEALANAERAEKRERSWWWIVIPAGMLALAGIIFYFLRRTSTSI